MWAISPLVRNSQDWLTSPFIEGIFVNVTKLKLTANSYNKTGLFKIQKIKNHSQVI